ncbi:hypothetical protein J4E83_001637 [Alternaria metachromatica]|uniref:uncharacterized protein n=1 Tax=Alternaria metachromatica TaxID=283354 RepID=UPI0020C3821C|nr:uncharacterized protein J4E83_001637 [Alternaria metachromatica]XP_049245787.1 uncharacterized protein J4E84_004412 [Alternaria hordeiaustralica]KAI4636680.1 hypothetical protein J4E83_001637 [Alternaria metachromatica]KAI4690228.1 hypothetical protein J4E84_004412 [Alternaria hordeiaustralica]
MSSQLADMKLRMAAKDRTIAAQNQKMADKDLAIAHYHKKSKSRKFRIEELEADLEEAKEKIAEIDSGDSDATNVQYIEDKPKEAPEYYDDYYGPCIEAQAQVQVLKAENANLKYQYFVSGLTIQPWSGAVVEPAAETTFPNDEPSDETIVTSAAETASPTDEPSDETIVAPEADPAPADDEPRGHKRTLSQSEVASTEKVESKKARPAFWSGDLTRRPKKNKAATRKTREGQNQV